MATQNYLSLMIDSLNKKKSLLQQIVDCNEVQKSILDCDNLDRDAFESNMLDKGNCIDEINILDEGFQSLYNRVKVELETNREDYTEEIKALQQLIREVTELGTRIEVQEKRNKVKVEEMFRRERKEHQTAKRSASMAQSYYQSMNKLNFEPQFMDTKK
ncbi:MAG: flagellar protein FliT [Lachnospira sp.]